MNYKTTKIEIDGQIVEVPVFRFWSVNNTENTREGYFTGFSTTKDKYCRILYRDEDGALWSRMETIPIWEPSEGEYVLYNVRGSVCFGMLISETVYLGKIAYKILDYCTPVNEIAKYDPSKPIPETWEEVEKTCETLNT